MSFIFVHMTIMTHNYDSHSRVISFSLYLLSSYIACLVFLIYTLVIWFYYWLSFRCTDLLGCHYYDSHCPCDQSDSLTCESMWKPRPVQIRIWLSIKGPDSHLSFTFRSSSFYHPFFILFTVNLRFTHTSHYLVHLASNINIFALPVNYIPIVTVLHITLTSLNSYISRVYRNPIHTPLTDTLSVQLHECNPISLLCLVIIADIGLALIFFFTWV